MTAKKISKLFSSFFLSFVLAIGFVPIAAFAETPNGGSEIKLYELVEKSPGVTKDKDGVFHLSELVTLDSGTYVLEQSMEVVAEQNNARPSGLKIAEGATVTINLGGHELHATGCSGQVGVRGEDGTNADSIRDGRDGAGQRIAAGFSRPGIELPTSSTLIFYGMGQVYAKGGNATQSGEGGNGGNGYAQTHVLVDTHNGGGAGGGGGGGIGASAGIGTPGTKPVASTAMPPKAEPAGKLIIKPYIDGDISLNLHGGDGAWAAYNGSAGEDDRAKDWAGVTWAGGGGGGGGGGATAAAPGYGSGGQASQAGSNGGHGQDSDDEQGNKKSGRELTGVQGTAGAAGVAQQFETSPLRSRYNVDIYKQRADGSFPDTRDFNITEEAPTGEEIRLDESFIQAGQEPGYVFDAYNPNNVVSGVLTHDWSMTFKLYYVKAADITYTVEHTDFGMLEGEGGKLVDKVEYKGLRPGSELPKPPTVKANTGYDFLGWNPFYDDRTRTNQDTTYTALFRPSSGTEYTVLFFFANKDGEYPEEPSFTELHRGVNGDTIKVQELFKDRGGDFYKLDSDRSSDQETIKPDGSTVVKVSFKPKQIYTVTYDPGDYGWFSEQTYTCLEDDNTPKFKGDPIGMWGMVFDGWKINGEGATIRPDQIPEKVTGDVTYVAQWSNALTKGRYRVERYYEYQGQYSDTPFSIEDIEADFGTQVALSAEDMESGSAGYQYEETDATVASGVVEPGKLTVLKAYFAQKLNVAYFPGDHGTFDPVICDPVDYGAKTPNPPTVSAQDGYEFAGWEPEVASTVTEDVVYVATWKGLPCEYSVAYLEKDTNKELAPSKEVTDALTGDVVTEKAIDIEGYDKCDPAEITWTVEPGGKTVTFYYVKHDGGNGAKTWDSMPILPVSAIAFGALVVIAIARIRLRKG